MGTTSASKNPVVRFTNALEYSVKLITSNAQGFDTLTKTNYIKTYSYSTPSSINPIEMSDGSIGISKVVLLPGIDTSTHPTNPIYQYVQGNQKAVLYRGKKNQISVFRPANTSSAILKAWIDYNRNGDFESSEMILNAGNMLSSNWTDTFRTPENQAIKYLRMRVGICIGAGTLNPTIATLGVFRDYNLTVGVDTIKPTIALNSSNVLYVQKGVAFSDPWITALDNIEGDISHRAIRIGNVDTSSVGMYILKYFVKDLYSNLSDTIQRTVYVTLGQAAPTITLIGDTVVYMEVNTSFVEPGFIAKDNGNNDLNPFVVKSGNLDTSNIGTYKIFYTVTDAFDRTAVISRKIVVRDTKKPIISAKYSNPYLHLVKHDFEPWGLVNVDDNSKKTILPLFFGMVNVNLLGSYNTYYKAYDASGNQADSFLLVVTVADTLPPFVADTNQLNPVIMEVFSVFKDSTIIFTDNFYPSSSIVVTASGTINTNLLGTYTRIYTATDPSGNKTLVQKIIKVIDSTKPRVVLLGDSIVKLGYKQQYEEPGVTLQDNYNSDVELRPLFLVYTDLPLDSSGKPFGGSQGIFKIKYVCADLSGNFSDTTIRIVSVTVGFDKSATFDEFYSIYPIPSTNHVWLESKANSSIKTNLFIRDLSGKVLLNSILDYSGKTKINLENLYPGIYILEIAQGQKSLFKKLLVSSH